MSSAPGSYTTFRSRRNLIVYELKLSVILALVISALAILQREEVQMLWSIKWELLTFSSSLFVFTAVALTAIFFGAVLVGFKALQEMTQHVPQLEKFTNSVLVKVATTQFWIKAQISLIGSYLRNFAVTGIGIVVTILLYIPEIQRRIEEASNIGDVFLAVGGVTGTILALVISLSIIPIQRAAETFSSSITRLYRDDATTQIIFISLASLTVLSFAFSVPDIFSIPHSALMPIAPLIIAAALDLVRWYQRHASILLQPEEAIARFKTKITKHISGMQNNVTHIARINISPETSGGGGLTQHELESILYTQLSTYNQTLTLWINELGSTATKALAKSDSYTAELAVAALADVAGHYLESRKDNLRVFPTAATLFLVYDTDARVILIPVYEQLKDINRHAINVRAESTSIQVVRALGKIASHATTLRARNFPKNSAPLTGLVLGYFEECVMAAGKNNLNDVSLEGSRVLLALGQQTPTDIRGTDVHRHLVKIWGKMALLLLMAGNAPLANLILADMMTLAHSLIEQKHFESVQLVEALLEELESLLSTAVLLDKARGGSLLPGGPLTPPYDLTNQVSIGYLVQRAATEIASQDQEISISGYSRFLKLNEAVWRHFRSVGEKVDLGGSTLLWYITHTIKHIATIFLQLLRKPVAGIQNYAEELNSLVKWYISFFWVAFSKVSSLELDEADDACDALAWIGLKFYEENYVKVTMACADNIVSAINAYCKVSKGLNPYNVADLLMYLWYLKILAQKKGDDAASQKIADMMLEPKTLTEDLWPQILKVIAHRQKQFEESLRDLNSLGMRFEDTAKELLLRILQEPQGREE